MASYSRELTLLGLLGATFLLPQCSLLTKVDWTTIPPAGGASNGGSISANAGEAGARPEAGETGMGGMAGEGGIAGESGEGGAAGGVEPGGGTGGSLGGGGSGGRGGTGGVSGSATGGNVSVGGAPGHTTCSTAPEPPTVVPDLSPFIVLFDGGPGANGDRGGRAGLDKTCRDARDALHLPHSDVRAVISVDARFALDIDPQQADQIVNMAAKYKIPATDTEVVSPIGKAFAPSWNAIWQNPGELPSLVCAGIMPATATRWLTGSSGRKAPLEILGTEYYGYLDASADLAGNVYKNACDGWKLGTSSTTTKAHLGSTIADHDPGSDGHPRFIDLVVVECNRADANVLCVAFDPTP